MASFSWPTKGSSGGGGVTKYATLSAFPPSAPDGTVAIALDTDILYAYSTTLVGWIAIGGPGALNNSLGWQEIPAGLVNNSNKTFGPLTKTVIDQDSILVLLDGAPQPLTAWSLIGQSIQFVTAPYWGQKVYVFYLYNGNPPTPPPPTGIEQVEFRTLTSGEASAQQLTLAATPSDPSKVILDVAGAGAQFFNDDYTVAGNLVIWSGYSLGSLPLEAGDKLRISYWS
jgi:hypothetical protein